MNIVKNPIACLLPNQTPAHSPVKKSSDKLGENSFNEILGGLSSGAEVPGVADLKPGLASRQAVFLPIASDENMSQGQLADLIESMPDLFAVLGEKLLELATRLLQDDQVDPKSEGLTTALDEIINQLTEQSESNGSGHVLAKLLLNAKQAFSDGELEGRLGELVKGLPERVKLKIKVISQEGNEKSSKPELTLIQCNLIAHMLGGTGEQVGDSVDGQMLLNDTVNKTNVVNLHEKIMIKLNIGSAPQATGASQRVVDTGTATNPVDTALMAEAASFEVTESAPEGTMLSAEDQTHDSESGQQSAFEGEVGSGQEGFGSSASEEQSGKDAEPFNLRGESDREPPPATSKDVRSTPFNTVPGSLPSANKAQASLQATGNYDQVASSPMPDSEGIIEQVVRKFDILVTEGKSEARIQLKPKHLGELKIHLVVENGSMKAVLDASSHQVKAMLEANLQSLKQSLEEQGFQVRQFDVSVGQHNEGRGRSFNRYRRGGSAGLNGQADIARQIQRVKASIGFDGNMAVNYLA